MKQSMLMVNPGRRYGVISRHLYGHFTEHLGRCIYQGIYVGEDSGMPAVRGIRSDVAEALRRVSVPVVRWPGGCFAETYHWQDGVGPKEARKHIVNRNWGGVTENNAFGTHEFLDFCEQVGCEPYLACNMSSGSVREAAEWVEYITMDGKSPMADLRKANGREEPWKLKWFGFGNENWGCGGPMRPEYYADMFRQYAGSVRSFGKERLYRIACGPNGADYEWTDTLMRIAGRDMDALSLHYYTMPDFYDIDEFPGEKKGSATDFDEGCYYRTLRRAMAMEGLIEGHWQMMRRHDKAHRVKLVVDEWGTWHTVEPGTNPAFLFQQNTMRDAVAAAVTLNIFNRHSDKVVMANLAQMVNVLQSMVLTEGPKMLLTPTYHVFDLYRAHQDATLIESHALHDLTGPAESPVPLMDASASVDAQGAVHVTAVNLSAGEAVSTRVLVSGMDSARVRLRTLSGDIHARNTFDAPEQVKPAKVEETALRQGECTVILPPCSVTELTITQECQ